jgi:hypothetical protein
VLWLRGVPGLGRIRLKDQLGIRIDFAPWPGGPTEPILEKSAPIGTFVTLPIYWARYGLKSETGPSIWIRIPEKLECFQISLTELRHQCHR